VSNGASPDLSGRVAIVTGAGRGLGRAIAGALAAAGASVTVASRTGAELDDFVAEQDKRGRTTFACPVDVTNEDDVQNAVDRTVERFGRLDILVNNSGIIASTPLLEQEPAEWDRVVATNLRGVYLMTRAAGRHLVAQKSGKVVNIASNFALQGVAHHAAYSASKAAVLGFTRAMAIEWVRHGVQVNAIAPGYFATPLNGALRENAEAMAKVTRAIPARRMGDPTEITPWVLLLAGPASDFMVGETLVLDGGQSVR
jgi:NAD(P)-dependent dehydrogenase (short-subunit alcohol dehydrogenase family)